MKIKIKLSLMLLLTLTISYIKCYTNPCLHGWIVVNGQCRKSCIGPNDCNKGERCIITPEGNICGR